MRWDLHGLTVAGESSDADLRRRWQASFASRPAGAGEPDVTVSLNVVPALPPAPAGEPQFRQGDLLAYYVEGEQVTVHFPRYGRLDIDLQNAFTGGEVVKAALDTYGVLEDLVAMAISPHLRRRGRYLIHAFAAVHEGQAVLLVGDVGAGKTTTGMALLNAGWRLLSNDSPILDETGAVLSYPGLLTAYPDTLARFPDAAHLAQDAADRRKVSVNAEEIWPGVWAERASARAIFFPRIDAHKGHALQRLSAPETLRRLLPHSVEQWDRATIPAHLATLRRLVETAPGYELCLGPDVLQLADFLECSLNAE